ncbi:MAG: ABC transporter substrate-binding protein [Pseudonocardiaceae bacterium]|nr:ABC transporter substrate-binding protein [Pseudonocardiaceae bacterium]
MLCGYPDRNAPPLGPPAAKAAVVAPVCCEGGLRGVAYLDRHWIGTTLHGPTPTQREGAPLQCRASRPQTGDRWGEIVTTRRRRLLAAVAAGVLAIGIAGCGQGGDDSGGAGGTVTMGTTDKVTSLDPAGAYDLGSWTLISNMYQKLLTIPPGGNTPEPDAAQGCEFTDDTTYECTLQPGLTFWNGNELTAQDVVHTFRRMVAIDDPDGPAVLFASMESVAATDERTVVFTLKQPDATWPFVLTTPAASIVDADVFPADALLPGTEVVGSGPYQLEQYENGQLAAFGASDSYQGAAQPANDSFIVQYFEQPSALKLAIQQGEVDVAYRSLSPTDIQALRGVEGVKIVEGQGTEIRYMVFYVQGQGPSTNPAVRQAVAQLIDREAIARNAYQGTVEPLYSLIPEGLKYHTDAFRQVYGEPSADKARRILADAGVATPVALTLGYTPSHYGPNLVDEYTEVKRQLEASGLFRVKLASAEWTQYQQLYKEGAYGGYGLGWFPDFPDADNYTAPFLLQDNFYANGYSNPRVTELVAQEQATTDDAARAAAFEEIQRITARQVPVVPIWQGKQIAVAREGVTGIEQTFDPSFIFRFWLVGKSSEQ